MDHVISELCYKGKLYKGIIGKLSIIQILVIMGLHCMSNAAVKSFFIRILNGA